MARGSVGDMLSSSAPGNGIPADDPYSRPDGAPDGNGSSARSLLVTVLGTFVHPAGGSAWTASLLAALDLVGVAGGSARQALNRASHSGLLAGEKHGRRVCWQLTPRARELLSAGAERLYGFGRHERAWDGRWLLVLASIPERQRDLRYRLKVDLNWAGFGQLGPGLWISPWPEREPEAKAALAAAGPEVGARSFVASHGQVGDPASMVTEAWDLSALAGAYRSFIDRFAHLSPDEPAEAARALLSATHEWRWFPAHDPGLPDELLPPQWPGREAADLFARLRHDWTPAAEHWWASLEGTGPEAAG